MKNDKTRKWLYTLSAGVSVLAPYVVPHLKEIAQNAGAPAWLVGAAGAAVVAYKAFQADPDKHKKQEQSEDETDLLRPAASTTDAGADTSAGSQ